MVSTSGAPNLDEEATHIEAVGVGSHTSSTGADDVAVPEASAARESREDGRAIAPTTEDRHHLTKRRSAPALIQAGHSPTNSTTSTATLLNSPRRALPLTLRTPFGQAHVNDNEVITTSPSKSDLSSNNWSTHRKTDSEISRYRHLVEQLQADLATERENAQHDRGVAQQALGEAQDNVADLEAEVSELKDQLAIEQQRSQDYLNDYYRCDRDATAVIDDCYQRISELVADLDLEQRRARHNYAKAEELMLLAESWRDAFHQLGHNPETLWKMLVEELMVRGVVFDYVGRLHRVGLRRAVLSAEDSDETVAGFDDRSMPIHKAHEGDNDENTVDAMTKAGDTVVKEHPGGNASQETNLGQVEMRAEEKAAGDIQTEAETNEEYVAETAGEFGSNDDADRINEQTKKSTSNQCCGPEPPINVDTGNVLRHEQRQDGLKLGRQEDSTVSEVEDEANIKNVASHGDLADSSSNDNEPTGGFTSQQDKTSGDGYLAVPRMRSAKDRKMRAVSWNSGPEAAAWETGSRVLSRHTASLGSRHALPHPTIGNGLLGPLLWNDCRK